MRVWRVWVAMTAVALILAGCNTGKVSEQLANTETLAQNKQAIVFMRIANPDPGCLSLGGHLGAREGAFFRPSQMIRLQQIHVTLVVEVLLAPGEYHIVSLTCFRARSTMVLAEPQGNGLMRRSYATFTAAPGEVVNLGQLKLVPSKRSAGVFRSFHEVDVEVTDWPLSELERFKSQRPKHFAEMKVRLMTANSGALTPEVADQKCAELKKLQAEGKVQNVPAACSAPAEAAKRGAKM